jgi:hypothetical protein
LITIFIIGNILGLIHKKWGSSASIKLLIAKLAAELANRTENS